MTLLRHGRMTKVKALLGDGTTIESEAEPHECLHQVLQTLRQKAEAATRMILVPQGVTNTSSGALVHDWQSPEHSVGATDLSVVFQARPQTELLFELMERMAALEQRTEETVAFFAPPRIGDVAAELLIRAFNDRLEWSPDHYACYAWSPRWLGSAHPRIQQISNLTGTATETVAAKTDAIIARGSNSKKLRCTSPAELQAEVEACQRYITLFPALRQQLQWECWVLDNYAHFKTVFYNL